MKESIANLDEAIKQIEIEIKEKEAIEAKLKRLNELILKVHNEAKRDKVLLKISQLQKKLEQFENVKQIRNIGELAKQHSRFSVKIEQFNVKLEYLHPNFIVKGEMTLVAAPPASGKSLTSLKFSDLFLSMEKVQYVYYFDFDNGFITLKERKLDELYEKHMGNLIYIHPQNINDSEFNNLIMELQNCDLSEVFIVFDTTKNFIKGDRDKNKDVSKLMKMFKTLRDAGATILLLHHTNKPTRDLNELTYAGSSAWEEDTSNAFLLKKNDSKNTFLFQKFKDRVGEIKDIAFKLSNDKIVEVDYDEASETKEEEQARFEIISYIRSNNKCTYTQILKHVTSMGYGKDKTNKIIQEGKGKYWEATKNKANYNSDEFSLLEINTDTQTTTDNSYNKSDEEEKCHRIESDNHENFCDVEQNMNIDRRRCDV